MLITNAPPRPTTTASSEPCSTNWSIVSIQITVLDFAICRVSRISSIHAPAFPKCPPHACSAAIPIPAYQTASTGQQFSLQYRCRRCAGPEWCIVITAPSYEPQPDGDAGKRAIRFVRERSRVRPERLSCTRFSRPRKQQPQCTEYADR